MTNSRSEQEDRFISLIVAVGTRGVIGDAGRIPWHLSTDLRRFKQLTTGHTIIMGRRTFESLGRRLPDRKHIVLSRDPRFSPSDVEVVSSWPHALRLAGNGEVFVIGGGELYSLAMPVAKRIYLTTVLTDCSGDTYFRLDNLSDWEIVADETFPAGPRDDYPHRFQILERRTE